VTDLATDEAPVVEASAPRARTSGLKINALLYAPAVVIAIGGWAYRWIDEDAFINLRIVDQIYAGHGPVFNSGERIEAATSPLWLGILVGVRFLLSWAASMPWLTVLASLAVAVAAFVVAGYATRLAHPKADGVIVPAGLFFVAAVAVVWEFSTSGLEMGLVWLWLAASWLVLVRVAQRAELTGARRNLACIVLGLAPVVRPELTLTMLCLLGAWFMLVQPRRIGRDLLAIFAIPIAFEIFRMGYYATVVPNTALAKDAGGSHWGQGWRYVTNFTGPYHLWVPALFVVAILAWRFHVEPNRRLVVATIAMYLGGLLNALYITYIGGDYMHGRLLLPAFFAFALPVSFVVRKDGRDLALLGVVSAWALLSLVAFRPPKPPPTIGYGPAQVADWRTVTGAALHPQDVNPNSLNGNQAKAAYARGVRGYFNLTDKTPRPGVDPNKLVITLGSIGVPAYDAGTNVFVIDIGGLGEPLAARTAPLPNRPAGHRKQVDYSWYDARFGAAEGPPEVQAARRALACEPLRGLLGAIDKPVTVGRFFSNIWHSPSYTRLQVPYDPEVAAQKWCSAGP
jgi:arabinofuranosyltransferase